MAEKQGEKKVKRPPKRTEAEADKVRKGRDMKVYKKDEMVQRGRHQLSLQEQRCVLYAISKIRPDDQIFEEYTFELKDFYAICGLQKESYTELKNILIGLKSKTWWVETKPGEESTVSWFNKVRTNKKSGKVTIRFDDDMMPYLLGMSGEDGFFTNYNLRYVLPMKKQWSPKLYELLKSYQKNNRRWWFEIDYLKKKLGGEHYKSFADFRRFVLEPAVEEINTYTDLSIGWAPIKDGAKVVRVDFFMAAKKPDALLKAENTVVEALDGQVDMEELLNQLQNGEPSPWEKFQKENY